MQPSHSVLAPQNLNSPAGRHSPLQFARGAGAAGVPRWFDAGDATGEAALALCECRERYDESRGTTFESYAFARMRGRALDAVRTQARELARRTRYREAAAHTPIDPGLSPSTRLDLQRGIERELPSLHTAEHLVLREVYGRGATLAETARSGRFSSDQLARAHDRLIERLRRRMGVEPEGV
ncbi:MAG: sigma-70 family RNA polymerase sigma factor [Myxococcales bacterium]|nr:sigma-70 family RNA polymerase sigma factor [Myxococcales bacterium]